MVLFLLLRFGCTHDPQTWTMPLPSLWRSPSKCSSWTSSRICWLSSVLTTIYHSSAVREEMVYHVRLSCLITCQLSLFDRDSPYFDPQKGEGRAILPCVPIFAKKNLSIVMYRKFRNVSVLFFSPPISPYFIGFRVGRYVPIFSHFRPTGRKKTHLIGYTMEPCYKEIGYNKTLLLKKGALLLVPGLYTCLFFTLI